VRVAPAIARREQKRRILSMRTSFLSSSTLLTTQTSDTPHVSLLLLHAQSCTCKLRSTHRNPSLGLFGLARGHLTAGCHASNLSTVSITPDLVLATPGIHAQGLFYVPIQTTHPGERNFRTGHVSRRRRWAEVS
jgi:hypothetical protein